MYHIKQDKRSLRSAQLIYQGLLDCLEEKEFGQISISDLQRKSYVSRSTFYRLFDRLDDVVSYQTDLVFQEASVGMETMNPKARNLFFIQTWIKHHLLLEMIVKSNLQHLLYQGHQGYVQKEEKNSEDRIFLSRLLSSTMMSSLISWIENGRKETAEQLYEKMTWGFREIQELLEQKS